MVALDQETEKIYRQLFLCFPFLAMKLILNWFLAFRNKHCGRIKKSRNTIFATIFVSQLWIVKWQIMSSGFNCDTKIEAKVVFLIVLITIIVY